MLIDDMDAVISRSVSPWATSRVIQSRYAAARFKISDETTKAIAAFVRTNPSYLLDNIQFAIPPSETTYIEFNLDLYVTELGSKVMDARFRDHLTGFLIKDGLVTTIFNSNAHRQGYTTPIVFSLKKVERDDLVPIEMEPREKLWYIMGSSINNETVSFREDILDMLQTSVGIYTPRGRESEHSREGIKQFIRGSYGEVRSLLAILLWINQPRVVSIVNVPASRHGVGSKLRVEPSYRVVNLPKDVTINQALKVFRERSSPRLHEVRTFIRNMNKNDTCEHDWPIEPDRRGHWHCRKCPQYRLLVKEFLRGDPERGVVEKEYSV